MIAFVFRNQNYGEGIYGKKQAVLRGNYGNLGQQ